MQTYKIVKYRKLGTIKIGVETIKTRLTLQQAKEYCSRADTNGGGWFCAFVKE